MVTRIGTALNDILRGTAGSDTLNGLSGNDSLFGNDGADALFVALATTGSTAGQAMTR